jgi:AcrR family transcriptional regulator
MEKSIYQTTANELFDRELSRTEKRKLQVVNAALELFAKRGFDSVSFEDIALKCKVSRPLISHYFKDKTDLFNLVTRYVRILFQKAVVSEMQKENKPESIFKAYIRATLRWNRSEPLHFRIWMLFYSMCSHDSKMRKEHSDLVDLGTDRIIEILKNIPSKQKTSDEELRVQARLLQIIMTGSLITEASEERTSENPALIQELVFRQCCNIANVPY